MQHPLLKHKLKHLFYSIGWKKFEPVWNFLIKTKALNQTLPALEAVLAKVKFNKNNEAEMASSSYGKAYEQCAIPIDLKKSQFVNLNS